MNRLGGADSCGAKDERQIQTDKPHNDAKMLTTQATPPFTREALEILFEQSNFHSFQKSGYLSHYWAPLISVCSGTRRDEIFYLTPDDILRKYGIWVIQINTHGAKQARSGAATRDIPIHPTLKRLGLLEFVRERRRTHPNERLFSEYKAIQEHAGMLFSRAFVNWIKTTVGRLPDEQKILFGEDFHFPSLRALFSTEAIRSGMSERTFRQVHGIGNGLQPALDSDREQGDLENADAEMRRVDIESYFPALCTYEELMGSNRRQCSDTPEK